MIFSTSKEYKEYKKDGAIIYEYPYTKFLSPALHKKRGLIPSVKAGIIPKLELLGYSINTMKYLIRISKNYDVIHAHWFLPSGFFACLLKSKIKKPILTTAWGAEFHLSNNMLTRKFLNYVNTKSDCVVTPSNYMKVRANIYGLDVNRIDVIPNSTDLKMFSLKRKESDKIIIGTARRLVHEKRVQDLIMAFSKIKNINSELWILGDGPEMDNLVNLSKKLKCVDKIKFLGMINHKEIPSYFSKMDICVNPSIQESMATITMEAMSAGCVMVATDGCGNDEVITSGKDGFLYEGTNVNDLKNLLQKLVDNPDLRKSIRTNAIERAKFFSSDKIAERYRKFYIKLVN